MAILNGTNIGIYIAGTKVAHATSSDITTSESSRDASSKDSAGWKDSLEGMKEWSMEGEAFFDFAAAYGYDELFLVMQTRASVTVRFSTETSAESYHEGTARLVDLSASGAVEDSTTFSFSFEGTGPLNYTILT